MPRIQNWHAELAAQFEAAKTRTFAWGSFDCGLFACDCARAQTGASDPGAGFRGKYSSEEEAAALIDSDFGGDFAALVAATAAQSGFAEIGTGHAGRGDLVLIDNGAVSSTLPSCALAVVDFSGMYAVCPGSRGLIRVRRHRWKRAWKV